MLKICSGMTGHFTPWCNPGLPTYTLSVQVAICKGQQSWRKITTKIPLPQTNELALRGNITVVTPKENDS